MLYAIVILMIFLFFFFNDTATTEIYTLSLHDALPISTSHYDHDFDNTLQKLLADECQVYAVQTGVYDNANVRDLAAERRMQEFSSQTGGSAYIPHTVSDLDSAFAQISADLAQQYVLSYYPAADKRDGKYHQIAVRVKTPANARVRSRKGFLVKVSDRV